MKKVFLTGATGNVGGPVLKELLARNYSVRILSRRPMRVADCEVIVGDLTSVARFKDHVRDADAVVHLASPRGDSRASVVRYDILGTGKLLDQWTHGKFVYLSSQVVYGIPSGTLLETSPLNAMYWYDLGKVCNEFQVLMTSSRPNLVEKVSVILRMALLFGSGDRRNDRQFLPLIYQHCVRGSKFVFDSEEGLQTYGSSFIGPRDLARGVADSLALDAGGAFNISGGFCTWKRIIDLFCRSLNKSPGFIIKTPAIAGKGEFRLPQSISLLDCTKFGKEMGFQPSETIEELIERYLSEERKRVII